MTQKLGYLKKGIFRFKKDKEIKELKEIKEIKREVKTKIKRQSKFINKQKLPHFFNLNKGYK